MVAAVAGSTGLGPTGNITPSTGSAATLPANIAVGDRLVAWVYWAQINGGAATLNTPSGWDLRGGPGTSSNRTLGIYEYRVTNAAALSALGTTVTFTAQTASGSRLCVRILRITGSDLTVAAVVGAVAAGSASASSYTFAQPASGALKIFGLGTNTSSPSTGSAFSSTGGGSLEGTTRAVSAASGSVADSQLSTLVGGTGATSGAATANWVAYGVGIANAAASNTPPTAAFTVSASGLTATVSSTASDPDGSIASTSYDWGDGTSSAGPTHAYTAAGTYTVTQTVTDNLGATGTTTRSVTTTDPRMLAIYRSGGVNYPVRIIQRSGGANYDVSPTIYTIPKTRTLAQAGVGAGLGPWLTMHRGGSYNYPEETLYGYQGCLDSGAQILEVSLQRSSQGTWWCFHDSTVDRTVSGGQTGAVSSFTDAQLAAMSNKGGTATGNTGQPARPVAKFSDVLAAFPSTPMFVEDKTQANTPALLDLLDANGGTTRFVVKLDALLSGTSQAVTAPKTRGYQTWAYIFDAGMGSLNAAIAKGFTMIGMDYNSSDSTLQSGIASCISGGVRPTGHIIPSQAQRDRLLGFGMTGLMLSNKLLLPRLIPLPS